VDAYAAVAVADAAVGQQVAPLAEQARTQLTRLEAASPGSGSSSSSSPTASSSASDVGADPRAWLRQQVTAAADSHAGACLQQSGARAALLGSLAAGLRGHAARLA
jgi:cellulase/cellobiase CelA1